MKALAKYLILFAFAALVATACRPQDSERQKHVFRYNESSNITSLDPAFARSQSNIWAINHLFNGLVQFSDQLEVLPAIAHSWSLSEDGLEYRFALRRDVFFHQSPCFTEGTRSVTAHDFVYSFRRLISPELAAPGAWVLSSVDTLFALSDDSLMIRLKSPFPAFLSLLCMQYCSVVPKEAVDYYGSEFSRNPVGTGPFYFKLWAENEKLILRRNPNYFEKENGEQLPFLEAVAITFIPDKQSAFMEFLKGNLDMVSGLDPGYKDELLSRSGELREKYRDEIRMETVPYLNTEYLGILYSGLPANNPLAIREVRQALNQCFDRERMMRFLRNNVGTAANQGFVPKGLAPFSQNATYGYSYDPQRAAELLVQAGYPKGQGLGEIVLLTNSSYLDLCEFLQSEAAKIGLNVRVEVTPPSTLRQMMATAKADFFRGSWIADYPDAENYLSLFYSANKAPNGPNYTQFSNPLFDRWYEEARLTTELESRLELYAQMDSLVMYEAPIIPLYYDQVARFYRPGTEGLQGNPLNLLTLKRVRKR